MRLTDQAEADEQFRQFVLGCQPRMVHLADLLTRDRGRAEDLVQHAFTKAYAVWGRLRHQSPEAYVRRCVTNAYIDWWRRRPWRERSTDTVDYLPTSDDLAAEVAERDAVLRALARLTRRERTVLVLRYYCGLSEGEIAAELAIRAGTVKSTAARAMGKLRTDETLSEEVA